MQGIDKIIETILHEAETDAQAVKEQNERHIESLRKKAETEVAAFRKTQMQEAMEKSFESERRAMTMLDVKKRRDDLAVKRSLIDEAFAKAVDRINNQDISSYRNFIVSMLADVSDTGNEEVITDPSDDRIDAALLQMANSRLASSGKTGNLKLSKEKREMTGGFVLLAGGVETNCTIPMLVQQQYALLEKEVAGMLFEA